MDSENDDPPPANDTSVKPKKKTGKKEKPIPIHHEKLAKGIISMVNKDNLCLFRSVIVVLAYVTNTLRLAGGTYRMFEDRKRFARVFPEYLQSQHMPLSKEEKKDMLKTLRRCGANIKNGHKSNLNAADLDAEIENAKKFLLAYNRKMGYDFDVDKYVLKKYSTTRDRVLPDVLKMMEECEIEKKKGPYDLIVIFSVSF